MIPNVVPPFCRLCRRMDVFVMESTMNVVLGLLLLAIPGTIAAHYMHLSPMVVMGLACVGIVPVARLMGQATEHMSHHVGPTAGGLMNATFGYACELIIAVF